MLVTSMSNPAIQDLVRKSFITATYREAGDVRSIFHKETSGWETDTKRIYEFDRERFAEVKIEGGASAQRGIAQGYYKDIKRKTISIARLISGEAFKALTAYQLSNYASQVADDVVDKIELDMRNFIGYGDATSYTDNGGMTVDTTVGDGFQLFYTAHTLKNSAVTYTNVLSGAPSFNEASIDDAEDFFNYNVMDNYGQRITMRPNTIITTRKAIVVNRVRRLLMSISPEKIEGTANSNEGVDNPYKGKYRHLIVEVDVNSLNVTDSTKSFYWYLACLGGMPETSFQGYYVSWLSPMVAPAEIDQDKWFMKFVARACYGIGALSGKGILLSKATA
jgi:hypothetical protein